MFEQLGSRLSLIINGNSLLWKLKVMMTLRYFAWKFESVPASASWYLADLGEARGKQELFTRQSPQLAIG